MFRPERLLPDWRQVLVVVAHPDDETFGLGAIADHFTAAGTAVHVLCFTHGEASTLNENHAELRQARDRELRQAAAELGVATVTLLDYPDGQLAEVAPGELTGQVTRLAAHRGTEGLLVLDDTGITGHRDHQAATRRSPGNVSPAQEARQSASRPGPRQGRDRAPSQAYRGWPVPGHRHLLRHEGTAQRRFLRPPRPRARALLPARDSPC
jgi:LmbE family N-acetylglucosaminyl deacetylase